jgi:hypothetical protein
MITPAEIHDQCLRWWKEVLIYFIDNQSCFPKEINRIGKVNSKDILQKISVYKNGIELLQRNSKPLKKHGYNLILEERQFDKIGKQPIPQKIIVESLEDYLQITGKKKELERFQKNFSLIMRELPLLEEWIKINPLKLIEHDSWEDTLKVCLYFLDHPKPEMYIRQLPIDIHTKYISENESIIRQLLEHLIPESINYSSNKFEERFNLLFDESLIRLRFLDNSISPIPDITYLSFTVSELNKFHPPCKNIFVTENKMNFITLPSMKDTIAIWSGGGFNVSHLKNIEWLKEKQFFYWGDIDAHGFQILHQFRTYFPTTMAVMMDAETLGSFKAGEGKPAKNQSLTALTAEELKLYEYIRKENIRLEQEKITQTFAEEQIRLLFQDH